MSDECQLCVFHFAMIAIVYSMCVSITLFCFEWFWWIVKLQTADFLNKV